MEDLDINSFSCDIIVEEKFIPDVNDPMEIEVNNVKSSLNNDGQHDIKIKVENDNVKGYNKDNFHRKSQILSTDQHKYKCSKCKKRYCNFGSLEKHEKICKISKNFECQETFTTEYEKHKNGGNCVKSSINDDIGPFKCDVDGCTAEFDLIRKLSRHKNAVHVPRRFACLYCDLTFKKKTHKTRHEKLLHLKKSQGHAKKTQKLKKSPESTGYKVKSEVENVEIKQELNDSGRVTRSRNKNTNFSSFFEIENSKISAKIASESDSDTSTTASFIDSDDEDNYEDLEVSKMSKNSDGEDIDKDLKMSKKEILKKIKVEKSDEYLCSVCNESFTTKMNVRNHEKNCKNMRIGYRKRKYNKKMISKSKPKLEMIINCEYENCEYICSSNANYNLHIDMVHNKLYVKDKRSRNCFLCRKSFKLKSKLEEHMKTPHKIKCPECSMIFVENAQLYRHRTLNHLKELKKIQCPNCPKTFLNQKELNQHTEKVHEKKMRVCPICSDELSTFKFSSHLDRHKRDGSKKLFCEICKVYFTNQTKLGKHFKTKLHLEKVSEKQEFEEFILPHDINTSNSNTYRLKDKSDEGIYDPSKGTKSAMSKCPECDLKFKNYFYRDAHREKFHGLERPKFHCQLCNMNFTRNSCLKNHIENSMKHKLKEKESKN